MYNAHAVYANTVIFSYTGGSVTVILERSAERKDSEWGLPTTPVSSTHTSLSALEDHLRTFTGIHTGEVTYREQLYTTEFLVNAQRAVCISYIHICHETAWHKGAGHIGLFPLGALPKLSQLDQDTITYATDRLKAKAVYTNIVALLLPGDFSLTMLQDAYEIITGRTVDRRNFRKKIISLDLVTKSKRHAGSPTNTPQPYHAKDVSLRILDRPL